MTETIEYGCPSSGCYVSHTAVVQSEGLDKATTTCRDCLNNIMAKTRDGQLVTVKVI